MVSMVRADRRFLLSHKCLRFRKFILIGIQVVLSFSIVFYVFKFSEESTSHDDQVGKKLPTKSVVSALNIHFPSPSLRSYEGKTHKTVRQAE